MGRVSLCQCWLSQPCFAVLIEFEFENWKLDCFWGANADILAEKKQTMSVVLKKCIALYFVCVCLEYSDWLCDKFHIIIEKTTKSHLFDTVRDWHYLSYHQSHSVVSGAVFCNSVIGSGTGYTVVCRFWLIKGRCSSWSASVSVCKSVESVCWFNGTYSCGISTWDSSKTLQLLLGWVTRALQSLQFDMAVPTPVSTKNYLSNRREWN